MTQYIINAVIKGTGTIQKLSYDNGTLALVFNYPNGPTTLSVNLVAYGLVPAVGEIYVKNYNEGEGLVDELERVGIAERVPNTPDAKFGYDCTATLMKVLV